MPWEVATEVSVFTRHAVERLQRFAFETAQSRPRKHLTVVTKSNAQRNGMVMWDEVAAVVAKDFPDVTVEKMLVDAMTCRMVLQPNSLDTIVATNLHADILSDLAAALAGSIGKSLELTVSSIRVHANCAQALLQRVISTPQDRIRRCLNPSMGAHLTSQGKELLIRWEHFGQQLRC